MDIIRDSWPQDVLHLMQELFGYAPPSCIGFTTKTHRHSTEFIEPVVKPSNSSTRNLLEIHNIISRVYFTIKKKEDAIPEVAKSFEKNKKGGGKKKTGLESMEAYL